MKALYYISFIFMIVLSSVVAAESYTYNPSSQTISVIANIGATHSFKITNHNQNDSIINVTARSDNSWTKILFDGQQYKTLKIAAEGSLASNTGLLSYQVNSTKQGLSNITFIITDGVQSYNHVVSILTTDGEMTSNQKFVQVWESSGGIILMIVFILGLIALAYFCL